jgi:hypothetical protein
MRPKMRVRALTGSETAPSRTSGSPARSETSVAVPAARR